jgi:hypothetical protein
LLQVLVVHGERGTNALMISQQAAAAGLTSPRFAAHAPPLPITFGTHHSKAFLLGYRHGGLRLIVHTANLIYPDCNNKTQGLWYQVRHRSSYNAWLLLFFKECGLCLLVHTKATKVLRNWGVSMLHLRLPTA